MSDSEVGVFIAILSVSIYTSVWFGSFYVRGGLPAVTSMVHRWWPWYPMLTVICLAVGPLLTGYTSTPGVALVATVAVVTLIVFAVANQRWLSLSVMQVTVAMVGLGCLVVAADLVAAGL